jgi:hypothetical protein
VAAMHSCRMAKAFCPAAELFPPMWGLNQHQYGSFRVWTEACMYHAIVKRIALQNFLRVNRKDYTPILQGCSVQGTTDYVFPRCGQISACRS